MAALLVGAREPGTVASDRSIVAPPNVVLELDGLRYEYSAVSGCEFLWDVEADPSRVNNLAPTRTTETRRLRALLADRIGVGDLDVLHEPYRATAESLRGLGYL